MPSPRGLRARRAAEDLRLPDVEPIAPVGYPTAFNDPAWLFEPKYDGFRGLVYLTTDKCVIRSKRGNTFKRFGSLCTSLREQVAARTAILDGEVLAVDGSGRPVFTDLFSSGGRLAYVAFDLLWLDGRDLRDFPLTRRKAKLANVLPYESADAFTVMTVEEQGLALFEAVRRLDLEGIVAKRKADPYDPRTVWYKVKNRDYSQRGAGRPLQPAPPTQGRLEGGTMSEPNCEVPHCPNPVAYGLTVCEPHFKQPATPQTREEAVTHLRSKLAHYDRLWPDPDRADNLLLYGSYDIGALRTVLGDAAS